MCQHDFRGRRIFQHRNQDKWSLFWPHQPLDDFLFEKECLESLRHLRQRWKGRFQFQEAWRSSAEKQMIARLVDGRFEYRGADHDWQPLAFCANGTMRHGGAGEGTWDVRERRGQLWLGLFSETEATAYLPIVGEGVWRGQGRGPGFVELRPLSPRASDDDPSWRVAREPVVVIRVPPRRPLEPV
jgi:hypothetical protein